MSIDPKNDRICYYESILNGFVNADGYCNIRGAAEKIVEMEAAKTKEQRFEPFWNESPIGVEGNFRTVTPHGRPDPETEQPVELSELKPCPFCAGPATILDDDGLPLILGCDSEACKVTPQVAKDSKEDAIIAWNLRPTERESLERAELLGFINGLVQASNHRPISSTTHDGANSLNEIRHYCGGEIEKAQAALAELDDQGRRGSR